MIPSTEAARAINYHRQDAVVVSTSAALRDWTQVSQRRDLDVDLTDCMDRAPAVGLGLSLAQPDRKVLVLDCDATLRTDLGSLATIGESKPENLVHFVFDDVTYSSTDGIPVKGLDNVNFLSMAQGAGYSRTFQFDALEEFSDRHGRGDAGIRSGVCADQGIEERGLAALPGAAHGRRLGRGPGNSAGGWVR